MGNTPPAPACSNPNEVSLMISDPGCCGAHYALQSRAPDPRLLAFVTADEYAKKLEALDAMFVAQSSRVRLLEKLKRHRCVVALVFLTKMVCHPSFLAALRLTPKSSKNTQSSGLQPITRIACSQCSQRALAC